VITVIKRDHAGNELARYTGDLLERTGPIIKIATIFEWNVDAGPGVHFRRGDRLTEWFYADRWYNVFVLRSDGGALKGWYCNLARPARFDEDVITQEDLALDLFIFPDGRAILLDADEYTALNLPPDERVAVRGAVRDVLERAKRRELPFEWLPSGAELPTLRELLGDQSM
jgi:hypothetical protein